jgi:hypothetical protein
LRDFWEVLKRRAHRLKHPTEVLTLFGLPADGAVPSPTTFDELMRCADALVKGDPATPPWGRAVGSNS